ncbi:MAG TPA: Crp/Fnr family transcriptional regulator [Verrucomicrobiae bacterium]|nr:Crp/Fnr family transcriptional regulator [Verrucomicrobiae bacterium]
MSTSAWDLPSARLTAVASTLAKSPIFAASPADELSQIAAVCQSMRLGKDDYLFRENEPAAGFFVVQSGAVSVHRMGPGGKEMVIHVFRSPESFAEAALAADVGYPADARAIEPSTVLLVPRQAFLDLIRRKPEMALRMLASVSLHLRTLVSRLDDLQLKDVETRLLFWIDARLRESGPSTKSIQIRGTKRSLALELGVTSETLSRTFASLRERALIRIAGTRIDVPNRSKFDLALKQRLSAGTDPSPKTN